MYVYLSLVWSEMGGKVEGVDTCVVALGVHVHTNTEKLVVNIRARLHESRRLLRRHGDGNKLAEHGILVFFYCYLPVRSFPFFPSQRYKQPTKLIV
jgi:hypothetical protein